MLGMIGRPYFTAVGVNGTAEATYSATFPKSNLFTNDYGRVMRTTSGAVGTYNITIDLGSAKSVNVIAFLWHNLRSTDTIQVLAGTTIAEANTGVSYASAALAAVTGTSGRETVMPYKFVHTLSVPVTARYWTIRVNVVGSAVPSGYVQASRAVVGRSTIFAIGPQRALLSANDLNQSVTLENGEVRGTEDDAAIRPIAGLSLKYAKESEIAEVVGAYTLGVGASKPMMVCTDLTAPNFQDVFVFGKPERVIQAVTEIYDVWEFDATVQSIGP